MTAQASRLSALQIRRVSYAPGAEVRGVDLTRSAQWPKMATIVDRAAPAMVESGVMAHRSCCCCACCFSPALRRMGAASS
jgi:hypothetical protein